MANSRLDTDAHLARSLLWRVLRKNPVGRRGSSWATRLQVFDFATCDATWRVGITRLWVSGRVRNMFEPEGLLCLSRCLARAFVAFGGMEKSDWAKRLGSGEETASVPKGLLCLSRCLARAFVAGGIRSWCNCMLSLGVLRSIGSLTCSTRRWRMKLKDFLKKQLRHQRTSVKLLGKG